MSNNVYEERDVETKLMTEKMQEEQLNILDALVILKGTITTLETMSECEVAMSKNIRAAIEVARKFDIDAKVDYDKFHRVRRPSKKKRTTCLKHVQ